MNRIKQLLTVITIAILFGSGCTKKKSAVENEQNQYLLYAISGLQHNECVMAVATLNKCISDGYGYDPNLMCSASQTSGYTTNDYSTLQTCAEGVIATTNCQLDANKTATASLATSGIFKDCDVPSGILKVSVF